ncbi:MAG: Gfo/Idh/MocA family protein [Acetobacteraceae bacterium]
MPIDASAMARESGRRLRLGMVGGGRGAFIGMVHRIAARLDDRYELVAGALSADAERARASAADLRIAPARAYADYREMARAEAARRDGIEVVAIVTPNHLHAPAAAAFLDAGIDVICDKPLSATLPEALELVAKAREAGRIFVVTYNNTGHAMVRQAREMVRGGAVGAIRLVHVEYAQGWLSEPIETQGQKQATWRLDPARAGIGGCISDIGTHAFNLAAYVTGLALEEVCAELTHFVASRKLDDNASVLLRYGGGARGVLWASQVAPGNDNALKLRVYGERGGLEWAQERPDELLVALHGSAQRRLVRGGPDLSAAAARATRLPAGHPEGYPEAFANIYADAAELILARREGRAPDPLASTVPTVIDGAQAMSFVAAAVRSAGNGGVWTAVAAV